MHALRDSRPAINKPSVLRRRLADDGYLYLPGLLPGPEVAHVTDLITTALRRSGVTRGDLTVAGDKGRFTAESFRTTYPGIQRLELVHRLARAPELVQTMADLFDAEVFCHPALVVRLASPGPASQLATRAHQDFVVLHVCTDVLTAWIALTKCDNARQGLRLIPGSHLNGYRVPDPTAGGARPLYLPFETGDTSWATANYSPGDVVIFHSLTIHGGGPNTSEKMRLSIDTRYQRPTDPLRADFAHPHGWPATPDWGDLCQGWSKPELIHIPKGVELIPMPKDTPYGEFVTSLTAPPSTLIQKGRTP